MGGSTMPRTRLFDLRHSSDRDSRPRDTRREPRNPSADECRHRRLAVWRQHENDVPVAAAVPLLNGELFARAHWPSEPNALGSYTCNQPGYFTTMEGWLGEPAGNLAFAG